MNYRILLVEDEEHLQEAIRLNLEMEGYTVTAAGNGIDAVQVFRKERFNLAILDVMLPGIDGLTVCESIRLENPNIPVMFLTAKDSSNDKLEGLRRGADDYLTKPFNLEELLLRVKHLLRRGGFSPPAEQHSPVCRFGNNEVNFLTYEARDFRGKRITLTKKEVLLLKLLSERKNQVISRENILETVWGFDIYPSTRTIDNFILNFRKYFEQNPRRPQYFHSIRGVGYRFTG